MNFTNLIHSCHWIRKKEDSDGMMGALVGRAIAIGLLAGIHFEMTPLREGKRGEGGGAVRRGVAAGRRLITGPKKMGSAV